MNGFKRTAVLIAAVLVLAMAFAGCDGGSSASSSASTRQSATFSGYPMNARNQTITWFMAEGYVPNAAYADDPNRSPFHSGLAEALGVTITWLPPPAGTDSNQWINVTLASGDLPDVMFGNFQGQQARYLDEGVFHDLTPNLQQWSPAYWAWIHTNPAYDRAMKTDGGKYYGYGFFREDGGWNDTYLGPIVNKAWLDESNLPMPATIDDWDRTLRTFKSRYNATLSFAWSRVTGYGTGISGAFGAYSFADYKLYVDPNNRIQLANVQPEYRTQLIKFAEWWRDGLIDQNVRQINDTMARSNALNKVMGLTISSMGQLSNWVADQDSSRNGSNWVGLQYPKGPNNTLVMVPGGYGIGAPVAAITTNVKADKLELVMRAMDYAYTEEGNLYWNYGKKGVSWDYDARGNPMYLPLVTDDPNGLNASIDKYGGSTWSGNCIQATLLLYLKNTQQAIDANDLWFYPNQDVSAKWSIPNGLTLTTQESTREAELRTAITTYVNEAALGFITGQLPFSQWDAYVAEVNRMGLEELLRIRQGAYDRYLRR